MPLSRNSLAIAISAWAKRRAQSLVHAGRGLVLLWRTQWNFRIHIAIACIAVGLGFGFRITRTEWLILIGAVALVLTAEALNTSIERVVDLIEPARHPIARDAKDLAAAGVLIASICSAALGILLFGPRLWHLLFP